MNPYYRNATLIGNIVEGYKYEGYGTEASCLKILKTSNNSMEKGSMQLVAQIGVFVTVALVTLKELIYLVSKPKSYIKHIENNLSIAIFPLTILFIVDFNSCNEVTGLKLGWQWQIGAISITASWISFLSNVQMLPVLGIYVLMITDILKTFLKLAFIVIIFILAFALGFHCLLGEQVVITYFIAIGYSFLSAILYSICCYSNPAKRRHFFQEVFAHAGFSLTKTFVMMLGEIDFGDMIARHVTHTGIEPTLHMPYPELTVVYFVVFIALGSEQ